MADYELNTRDNTPRILAHTRLVQLAATIALLSALVFLAPLPSALGQTWTGGGGNVNWNNSGNWSALPVSGNNTDLIFGGSTNTGTSGAPLNQNIAIPFVLNSLTFNAGSAAFFLGGNALRFDGTNNSITQSSSNTVSIANNFLGPVANGTSNLMLTGNGTGVVTLSGTIAGGNGQRDYSMTKTGTSTFVLSGNATFDGAVAVNAGVLNIQNGNALGSTTGATTVASGATLQLQGGISVGNETLTLNGSGVSNTGALRNISGDNSYAGGVTQGSASRINSDSGTLTLTGAVNTGGFALTLGGPGNITVSGAISGSGALIKNDAGTVTLSAANTVSGATTVNSGTLTLAPAAGSALASTTGVTVNAGGTVLLGANNQINNTAPMTLAGGTFAKGNFSEGTIATPGVGALTLTAAGSRLDFGTGTVGALTFASFTPGGFSLTIDNWTGTAGIIGNAATDRLIFDVSQTANLGSFAFTGYAPGAVQIDLNNGFFEIVPVTAVPEPPTLIAAALAAGVVGWQLVRRGRRVKDHAAGTQLTMRLARLAVVSAISYQPVIAQADNESWTGLVDTRWGDNSNWITRQPGANDNAVFDLFFLNQPELVSNDSVGGIWMTGNIVPDVTISSTGDVLTLRESLGLGLLVDNTNGSKLTITTDLKIGSDQSWVNNSSNVVTITGEVDLNNRLLTIAGPGNFELDGVISNHGILPHQDAITFTGTGIRALAGANTYDGVTTINGGTLIIENNTGLGNIDGGTTVASGAQLQLQRAVTDLAIGAEALTLNGTGTGVGPTGEGALRNVVGNNSFAGQITLGSDSTIICGNNTLTLSGGIVNGGFTVTFGGDSNIDVTGVISGTGGLTKNDAGILTLTQLNTYTGTTTINGGILRLPVGDRIATTGDLVVSGGTFDVQGVSQTLQNVTLSSGSITGTGAGTVIASSFSVRSGTASAILGGSGATLTKTTAGTVILSGANTFTGATTVTAGTLTLSASSGGALGSTSGVTVNSGGTVLLGASNQINDTAPMTLDGGTFAKGNFSEGSTATAGVGALTLTASGSRLDFGTGTVGALTFASLTAGGFILTIDNWTGTAATVGSGSTDRLIFASDQSANLNSFNFTGYAPGALEFDLGGGFFEIVPTAVPEKSTWVTAALAVGVVGFNARTFLVRRRTKSSARRPAGNLLLAICCFALVPVTASATPREEIIRAVEVNPGSDFREAAPRQFLKAFTAVAVRVEQEDLPEYVTAAIKLRPELAPNLVTVALKIAAHDFAGKPQGLCSTIEAIVKAAVIAEPDAAASIAVAGVSALPQFRSCVVNAAIAAAPGQQNAIVNAVGTKADPVILAKFSVSETVGFGSPIVDPPVISPEQRPP